MSDNRTKRSTVLPALIVLLAALALGVYFLGGEDDGETSPAVSDSTQTRQGSDPSGRRIEGDPLALGKTDAPVVMVNYSDFQCTYCGKFARDSEPELIKRYVNTGILRIEWRDFPFFGADSDKAAMAGRAAAEQDKFWEFHDALYADQPEMNSGQMTDEFLAGIAGDIDLDVDRFLVGLKSKQHKDEIEKDFSEGHSLGISGTPAFLINGEPIAGAQPLPVFIEAIERAASEQR